MKNTVYLIRHTKTGAHKIGITGNWERRSRELGVGEKNELIRTYRVKDARPIERALHRQYDAERLPQTEYFTLNADQLADVMATLEAKAEAFRQEMLEKLKPVELTEEQRQELAQRRAERQRKREEEERKAAELRAAKEAQAERLYAAKKAEEKESARKAGRFFRLLGVHALCISALLSFSSPEAASPAKRLFLAVVAAPFMLPPALVTAGIQSAAVGVIKRRAQA